MTTPSRPAQAIIFDFDGTIADSFDIFIEALVVITKRSRPLTSKEVEGLRRSSTKEVIKKLGIKPWQVPLLLIKGRREISIRMERVEAFEGIPEALKQLASKYAIYILSTNSEENITGFLNTYQLNNYITKVYGNINLMGKAASLKRLQKKEALKAADCLYVGDETRDVEAARKVGMKCVAVEWGFNHPATLKSYAPDALANTPQRLPTIIVEQMPWNSRSQNS